jgi:hypothetical protein
VFCEVFIHESLNDLRINKSREFFKISISDAIKEVISSVCLEHDLLVRDSEIMYSDQNYIQFIEEELRVAKEELSLRRRNSIKELTSASIGGDQA